MTNWLEGAMKDALLLKNGKGDPQSRFVIATQVTTQTFHCTYRFLYGVSIVRVMPVGQ